MEYRVEVPVWGEKRDIAVYETEGVAVRTAQEISALADGLVVLVWSFRATMYVARYRGGVAE